MLYMATGKPAHLGCKFLLDVSVVNSPIVVELLVITVLFCGVLPAGIITAKLQHTLINNISYPLLHNGPIPSDIVQCFTETLTKLRNYTATYLSC